MNSDTQQPHKSHIWQKVFLVQFVWVGDRPIPGYSLFGLSAETNSKFSDGPSSVNEWINECK